VRFWAKLDTDQCRRASTRRKTKFRILTWPAVNQNPAFLSSITYRLNPDAAPDELLHGKAADRMAAIIVHRAQKLTCQLFEGPYRPNRVMRWPRTA
jgi:hypothetical protein